MDPFDEIKDNNKQYGDDGEKSVRYKAFISYRHCEPGKTIAKLLHKKLEYYRIPKELREKLSRNSLGRVFRDEAELPVTDSLSDAILEALRSTEYLIVICSPRLKESAWCMKEIEIFSKLHGKKNILPVLIEGEPEESFPESLFYEDVIEKDPEGNEVEVRIEKEPLAADTRKGTGSVRDAVIKLSAAMLGLNYDDLKQRHRVERLKRRTFFSGLVFFVVLIFLFQAIYFATTITRQKKELEMKYADNMAQNSEELLDMGYRMDALYAARSVLPDDQDDNLSADAFRALINASQIYKKDVYVPSAFISAPVMATSARVSPDAAIAVMGNESRYYIMDTKSGRVLDTFRSEYMSYAFYGSKGLIYAFDSKVYYYDYEAGTTVLLYEGAVNIYDSPSGNVVIIENDDSVCGYRGSEQIWQLDFDELGIDCNLENSAFSVDFTEKGTYAICLMNIFPGDGSLEQWLMMVDTSDGALKLCVTEPVNGYNISYVAADEDTISMLVTDRVSYMDMRLVNYDISKNAVTDELDLGKEFFNKISRFDNRIIICSSDRVVIYDDKLESINGFGVSS